MASAEHSSTIRLASIENLAKNHAKKCSFILHIKLHFFGVMMGAVVSEVLESFFG